MATLRLRNGSTVTVPDEQAPSYQAQGLQLVGSEAPVAQKRRRTTTPKPRGGRGQVKDSGVTPPPAPTSPATVQPVPPAPDVAAPVRPQE